MAFLENNGENIPSERLAFAAIWHQLSFEDLGTLLLHAEGLGYEAAYLDGDVSFIPSLSDRDVLDGWTVQVALTRATQRIRIASVRLIHYWSPFRLAQAIASLERIAPKRQRILLALGGQPADERAGIPFAPYRERVQALDESLCLLRRLWNEDQVHFSGKQWNIDGAKIRPRPQPVPFVEIGGAAPATLRVAARYADGWNLNVPVIASEIERASEHMHRACEEEGRDATTIERSLWFFARPQVQNATFVLEAYRRFAPWFRGVADRELQTGFLMGGVDAARERLAVARRRFQIDLPVVDVTGLPLSAAMDALEALRPSA